MKIGKNMKKNLAKWASVLACVSAMGIFQASALSLTIGDSHELGFVNFGIPAGDSDVTAYVNQLIGMAVSTTATALGNSFIRSANTFSPLDTAVLASRTSYGSAGSTVNINLGTGGYEYLLAKYDGPNYGTEVWYVGGLTGTVTIPGYGDPNNKYGISGTSLFTPGTPAPDGGTTAILLGAALTGLGLLRRKLA